MNSNGFSSTDSACHAAAAREVVEFLREQAEVVDPVEPAPWPDTDPDDRWVVAAALDGVADFLVTGDNDLLDMSRTGPIRVVTPRELWDLLYDRS